jgi:hypothetical protein
MRRAARYAVALALAVEVGRALGWWLHRRNVRG